MKDKTIIIQNVFKQYRLGQTGYRSLREDIAHIFKKHKTNSSHFYALNDVSFEITSGEAVGIIGSNGAGKSTILKLLAGVTKPSSGTVTVKGKIGALIELTAGFHPELTGRENIYLYGSIIGMKRSYIEKRFAEIVDFSGLEKFLDTPIKRYSSGMYARLGFSVSAHLDPDILLVDEVLSVGDYQFQEKCMNKMRAYRDSNRTILFVSHNLDAIRKLCGRVMLLKEGRLAYDGDVEQAIGEYYIHFSESERGKHASPDLVDLLEKRIVDSSGQPRAVFDSGEKIRFELKLRTRTDLKDMYFAMFIRHSDGLVVFDTSSDLLNGIKYNFDANRVICMRYDFSLNLLRGDYTLGCNIRGSSNGSPSEYLYYENNIFAFIVRDNISHQGIANLNARCSIEQML